MDSNLYATMVGLGIFFADFDDLSFEDFYPLSQNFVTQCDSWESVRLCQLVNGFWIMLSRVRYVYTKIWQDF